MKAKNIFFTIGCAAMLVSCGEDFFIVGFPTQNELCNRGIIASAQADIINRYSVYEKCSGSVIVVSIDNQYYMMPLVIKFGMVEVYVA